MKKERYFNPKTGKEYFLDEYEQEIEDNIEFLESYSPEIEKQKIAELVEAAKAHVEARTHVALDMATRDLEEVKYRASKFGISYKTLINKIIHKYAISPQEEVQV